MTDEKDSGATPQRSQEAGSIARAAAPHVAHTPGQWEARWECSAICVGERTLARIYWDEGRSAAENCANAHLIAAAPEMKEALKLATSGNFACPERTLSIMRAAILKAEGRE